MRALVDAQVFGYVNFTTTAEIFQRTIQQFTIELIPFRVYPVVDYFKQTRTVSNGNMNTYNRLSAYVSLAEIHHYYLSNWKACGNTFLNADGTSNMDEALINQYCGYNSNTITQSKDYTSFFPKLDGARWSKEFRLWTYNKNW